MTERAKPGALARTLRLIRPDVAPEKGLVLGGTVALLFEVVFRVLEPWPMKIVVDAVSAALGAEVSQQPATLGLLVLCGTALVVVVGLRALSN